MISIEDFKKALGETAAELTEEQILHLRDQQDKMAEIFFAMWIKKLRNNHK